MNKQKLFSLPAGFWYYFENPPAFFRHLWRECRGFVRRGLYGYADDDVWKLDDYLATWLPAALRHFASHHYGCPQELFDASATDDECHRWRAILVEMAQGFEAYRTSLYDFDATTHEADRQKLNRSLDLLKEYYDHLWD